MSVKFVFGNSSDNGVMVIVTAVIVIINIDTVNNNMNIT